MRLIQRWQEYQGIILYRTSLRDLKKKTIFFQIVTLVHTLMTHTEINLHRVLVVAPLNTVLNWQVEFEKWLAVDDRLEVMINW